jgi:hypothetical protein
LVAAAVALATVALLLVVALGGSGGTGQHVASNGRSPPQPAGPRDTRSRPSTTSEKAGLFAPDSVWNAPLAHDAAIDPASDVLVKRLRDLVAQNIADGVGPWIATATTSPLYVVPAGQPSVRVKLDTGSWGATLQKAFEAVPIPDDAVPADGPDAHMTIWQPSKDRLWEFYRANHASDGWHAEWGGAISRVSRFPGYFTRDAWPGLSKTWWGATATSLPVIAGTMKIDELKAGVIPHALAINVPMARSKVYSWPAQRSDGASTDPDAIPEGARFRLDPKLDISKLNLAPIARMMAEAVQRHGMIVRDQTSTGLAFFAENPTQYGTNPYNGEHGLFGGRRPGALLRSFPWQHLQVVKMRLRPERPARLRSLGRRGATSAGTSR